MKFKIVCTDNPVSEEGIGTIEVKDEDWKSWYNKVIEEIKKNNIWYEYDVDECQECGYIGITHLQNLLSYINFERNDK